MDNETLTPLLKRLVTAGFVTRTRNLNDEHRVQIDLTKAEEKLREEVCAVPEKIEKATCRLTNCSNDYLLELRDTLNELGLPSSG